MLPNEFYEASSYAYSIMGNGQNGLERDTDRENPGTCIIRDTAMQVHNVRIPDTTVVKDIVKGEKYAVRTSYQTTRWKGWFQIAVLVTRIRGWSCFRLRFG